MPGPLTSALAAALAAGAVVAASALGGGDERRPRPAPQALAPAPPPTRGEAISAAKAYSERVTEVFARRLEVDAARVRAAERAVAARALQEAVEDKRLSAPQREALLACFDDPTGCDRAALPATGMVPGAYGPMPVFAPPVTPHRRPVQPRRARRPLDLFTLFARELDISGRRLSEAIASTHRELRGAGAPAVDPDGVPPALPPGFAPLADLPVLAVPPQMPSRHFAPPPRRTPPAPRRGARPVPPSGP